jgi:hypothetical protein
MDGFTVQALKELALHGAIVAGVLLIFLGWVFRPESGEWFD